MYYFLILEMLNTENKNQEIKKIFILNFNSTLRYYFK